MSGSPVIVIEYDGTQRGNNREVILKQGGNMGNISRP